MEKGLEFPKVDAYFIECRAGSSYYHHDDHYRGPYSSLNAVNKKVRKFKEEKITDEIYKGEYTLTASFIRGNNYRIIKCIGEKLPDGRIICGERVFSGFGDLEQVCDMFLDNFNPKEIKFQSTFTRKFVNE